MQEEAFKFIINAGRNLLCKDGLNPITSNTFRGAKEERHHRQCPFHPWYT